MNDLYCLEWSLASEDINGKESHFRSGPLSEALMTNTVSATKKEPINWQIIGVFETETEANKFAKLVHKKQDLYQRGINCNFNRN